MSAIDWDLILAGIVVTVAPGVVCAFVRWVR